MLRGRANVGVAAVVCFLPALASAQATVIGPPPEEPREVEVPSREYSDIQSAIDAVPTRSTIALQPGRYTESLTVTGKTVHLKGSGAFGFRRTAITGADPDGAVITFGPGGGGTVSGMLLRGGAAGIKGVKEDGGGRDAAPAPIQVLQTRILGTGHGIFGSFSDITVRRTVIGHTEMSAFLVLAADAVILSRDLIWDAGAVGLAVYNIAGSGTVYINNTIFVANEQGGIAIIGDARPVQISDCICALNGIAGIMLLDAGQVEITGTEVAWTYRVDTPEHDGVGDGLLAQSDTSSAFIDVRDCLFGENERAGMLFDNCGGEIRNTTSIRNGYGIVVQGVHSPDFNDPSNSLRYNELMNTVTDGQLPVPDTLVEVPETTL